MVEFELVEGGKILINPDMVEAIEEERSVMDRFEYAGIKVASGRVYKVRMPPMEAAENLFPLKVTPVRVSRLGG